MVSQYNIFVDGSSIRNPGPSAWAVFLPGINRIFGESIINCPSGRIEVYALYNAIKFCIRVSRNITKPYQVHIFTDSIYCVKTWDQWLENWHMRQSLFKKKNADIWYRILILKLRYPHILFNISWVKGHSSNLGNNIADIYARNWAQECMDTLISKVYFDKASL
jgi:ribonuclease HI